LWYKKILFSKKISVKIICSLKKSHKLFHDFSGKLTEYSIESEMYTIVPHHLLTPNDYSQ
jgi:hypothetical protein